MKRRVIAVAALGIFLCVQYPANADQSPATPTVADLQKEIVALKAQQGRALISKNGEAPVPCDAEHTGTLVFVRSPEKLCICTFDNEWADIVTGKACLR